MGLIVQKYGGTSVGSIEKIKNVAQRLIETQKKGDEVVVVVSAMAGETDRLIKLAHEVADFPDSREYDVLVSTGEQVSVALLSMAIKSLGGKARSFMGHQVKILTDESFSKARIMSIEAEKVLSELKEGYIAVVAGFQGVDEAGNITTLGRGGSDTSAVALAAALGADICEIYTDVKGVYTADPNICPTARKIERISYEEMLEIASLGDFLRRKEPWLLWKMQRWRNMWFRELLTTGMRPSLPSPVCLMCRAWPRKFLSPLPKLILSWI